VPLPISRSQLDKLGERLASEEPTSDADYALFAQVADAYQAVLDQVEGRLRRRGLEATTRVKTTGTLIDKLRRDRVTLRGIHDLAGARIVVDGGRLEQDRVTARIIDEFVSGPKRPIKKDRRETPSFGYRAVHVIVFVESLPVEIQVRTRLQDGWAQTVERLADRWGRGLRYGVGPEQPGEPAGLTFPLSFTRGQVIEALLAIADQIDALESVQAQLLQLKQDISELDPEDKAKLKDKVDQRSRDLDTAASTLEAALDRLTADLGTQGDAR
jgi:ppGpp synthetase/RelA/SpoT-type nucleotidyltranferase